MSCDDDTLSRSIELRASCTTKNLHYIQNTNVHKGTLFSVVNLGSFDNNSMGRKIDSPSQGCSANQDLQ